MSNYGPRDYDRVDVNEDDGQKFYGYDNADGTTVWYDKNNSPDCITPTPLDDDD